MHPIAQARNLSIFVVQRHIRRPYLFKLQPARGISLLLLLRSCSGCGSSILLHCSCCSHGGSCSRLPLDHLDSRLHASELCRRAHTTGVHIVVQIYVQRSRMHCAPACHSHCLLAPPAPVPQVGACMPPSYTG